MYLKTTNAVVQLKNVKESHVRPQLSYFIYNNECYWEKHIDHAGSFVLEKGRYLTPDERYIYYVQNGVVCFSKEEEGESLPLFYLSKGSLCSEMHIIGHIATNGTLYALEECKLLCFPVSLIRKLILEDPQLSFTIMESIGTKYSVLLTRISEIGTQNLIRNIARLILDMCSFYSFNYVFSPPICQRELSNFFCVHRSSINRAIATERRENKKETSQFCFYPDRGDTLSSPMGK